VDWIPWLGQNGKYGYADRQGNLRIQPRFVDAMPFAFGRAPASEGGLQEWGFINAQGTWLVRPSFTALGNGRRAIGEINIAPKYLTLSKGSFLSWRVTLREGVSESYLIDEKNQVHRRSSDQWDFFPPEVVTRRAVEMNAQLAVIDDQSRFFFYLPLEREDLQGERPAGIMDREGNILSKPVYALTDDIFVWSASRNFPMLIKQKNRYGYIAPDGAILVPPRFSDADSFFSGYAKVKEGQLWSLLDTDGKRAAPAVFSRLRILPSGLIHVDYKGKNILWDIRSQRQWSVDIPPKGGPGPDFPGDFDAYVVGEDRPGNFTEAIVLITFPAYTGHQGIDVYTRTGVLLGTFQDALRYGASRAWLRNGAGKWGALDMAGRQAIAFIYDRAHGFWQGDVVRVEREGKSFYLDAAGREYRDK
jgi:hypothetical protein